jgi:hypothetical protein
VRQLASCRWVEERQAVLITGTKIRVCAKERRAH